MCGVGGPTIWEAQRRVPWTEFCSWAAYRRKRGSLNQGMRAERGFALLASLYANAHRKQEDPPFSYHDFAPHHDQPDLSLEEAMSSWS